MCEIVDDMLLGEGILTTVADARRRLLAPSASIIPRGGALWAIGVQCRPARHCGLDLSDQNLFLCDLAGAPSARTGGPYLAARTKPRTSPPTPSPTPRRPHPAPLLAAQARPSRWRARSCSTWRRGATTCA